MEETYNLTAIILQRRDYGEGDGRVTVYSPERGKLDLTVRGMKKIRSKLAGHLEPLTLASIMAIRGRQYDYVGAAVSENCYIKIKADLEKLSAAGEAIRVFNKIIKADQPDAKIFELLKSYFDVLADEGKSAGGILSWLFIFKLLVELGHKPELHHCVSCQAKITPAGMKFDLERGGLICGNCAIGKQERGQLTLSENSVKLLRLAGNNDLNKIIQIKINKKADEEIKNIVSSFLKYHF